MGLTGHASPLSHVIVPYEPAKHEAFVMSSWTGGAKRIHRRVELAYWLRKAGTRCVVAAPPPEEVPPEYNGTAPLYGWAAAIPARNVILWVYVRHLWGAPVRRRGVGTSLMLAAGADPSRLCAARYWSPYAGDLCRAGYKFVYEPPTARDGSVFRDMAQSDAVFRDMENAGLFDKE